MRPADVDQRFGHLRFAAMLLLVAACFLLGGASRIDVPQLILLQPFAVACLAFFLLSPGEIRWDAVKTPLCLLAALGGIVAVQLLPLPPSLWSQLPGHEQFLATAQVAGIEQPWRPISLGPDLTLATLVGLIVPLAVLIGFAAIPQDRTRLLLSGVLLGVALSTVLGMAQLAGGRDSPFYLFSIANLGSPIGVFANRNHQAALFAMSLPMLALWVSLATTSRAQLVRRWIAMAGGILILLMILVSGSRAGLALGAVALVAVAFVWKRDENAVRGGFGRLVLPVGIATAFVAIAAALLFSRDEAIQRIVNVDWDEESRLDFLPVLLRMAGDFFPTGAGFGTFDPAYRVYEPASMLSPQYLNHAHNDLVELLIVGGVPAMIVLGCFLVWLGIAGLRALKGRKESRTIGFARLGLAMAAIVLLASLVDYPLRTPLHAALLALACAWISSSSRPPTSQRAAFPAAKDLYR